MDTYKLSYFDSTEKYLEGDIKYATYVNLLAVNHLDGLESGINWTICEDNWKEIPWWFDLIIGDVLWIPHSRNSSNSIWVFLHIKHHGSS